MLRKWYVLSVRQKHPKTRDANSLTCPYPFPVNEGSVTAILPEITRGVALFPTDPQTWG